MGATLVSVVIPCLDSTATLGRQLDALATQEFDGRWEVIVVDDGSTDGTPELAESYADRLPDLRVLRTDAPRPQAVGLNVGARAARGAHLLVLDSDDEVAPGYVAAMAGALARHDVVGARIDDVALNPPWTRRREPMQVHGFSTVGEYLPVVVGAALGISRRALDAVGGFDEGVGALLDVDLSWRLQHAGYTLHFVPDAVLRYRYRTTLMATFRQKRNYAVGDAYLYAKYRHLGVPGRRLRQVVRTWAELGLHLLRVRDRADAMELADLAGGAVGRLQGSLRSRVFYL